MRKLDAPRVGDPDVKRYQKMAATVDAVEAGTWSGAALPARAALWEVTVGGSPRLDPPLPKAVGWITNAGVASGGDFVVGDGADGRIYRLFETETVPAEYELPFASAVTSSGLPERRETKPLGTRSRGSSASWRRSSSCSAAHCRSGPGARWAMRETFS